MKRTTRLPVFWAIALALLMCSTRAVPSGTVHPLLAAPRQDAPVKACVADPNAQPAVPAVDDSADSAANQPADDGTTSAPDSTTSAPGAADQAPASTAPGTCPGSFDDAPDDGSPVAGDSSVLQDGDVRGNSTYNFVQQFSGCPDFSPKTYSGLTAGKRYSLTANSCPTLKFKFRYFSGGPCNNITQNPCNFVMPAFDPTVTAVYQDVTPPPVLIASIGDSFGSGEGNPDYAASHWFATGQWNGHGDRTVPADEDRKCHRSTTAPAAVAANQLQAEHQNVIGYHVQFMNFACTGDAIGWELSDSGYDPKDATNDPPMHLHQLDDLYNAVCTPTCRKIDDLIISFGGNDIHFSDIIQSCINPLNIYGCDNTGYQANKDFVNGIQNLPNLYNQLQSKIASYQGRGMRIDNIFIVEYADPLTYENQGIRYCGNSSGVGFDLTDGISQSEAIWARDVVVKQLNETVRNQALIEGWIYVGGVASQYQGHGYCASPEQRYINNNNDARAVEGGIDFAYGQASRGTLHPNKIGQWQTGQAILQSMRYWSR